MRRCRRRVLIRPCRRQRNMAQFSGPFFAVGLVPVIVPPFPPIETPYRGFRLHIVDNVRRCVGQTTFRANRTEGTADRAEGDYRSPSPPPILPPEDRPSASATPSPRAVELVRATPPAALPAPPRRTSYRAAVPAAATITSAMSTKAQALCDNSMPNGLTAITRTVGPSTPRKVLAASPALLKRTMLLPPLAASAMPNTFLAPSPSFGTAKAK